MTTTTAAPARARSARWVPTARWLLRVQLTASLWTFGIIGLVALVAYLVARSRGFEPVLSIIQFVRYPGLWFGFSLAILAATAHVGLHVASGLTRRSFVVATVVAGLAVALVWAIVSAVALELEGVVYAAQGWPQVAGEVGAEVDPAAGLLAIAVPFAFSFGAGQLSGLLVGMAYYRLGGWWGTVVLPLTVAPIFAVGAGGLDDGQWSLVDVDAPTPVAAAVGVLVLVVTAAVYHLIVRTVPIRNVEA